MRSGDSNERNGCGQACAVRGQAAAVTAALAAKLNVTPAEVPLAQIHEELKKHGAVVPDCKA